MAHVFTPTLAQRRVRFAAGLAALVAFYLVGFDQGHALSLLQGELAFDQNLIHELVHDARHVAGLPCH